MNDGQLLRGNNSDPAAPILPDMTLIVTIQAKGGIVIAGDTCASKGTITWQDRKIFVKGAFGLGTFGGGPPDVPSTIDNLPVKSTFDDLGQLLFATFGASVPRPPMNILVIGYDAAGVPATRLVDIAAGYMSAITGPVAVCGVCNYSGSTLAHGGPVISSTMTMARAIDLAVREIKHAATTTPMVAPPVDVVTIISARIAGPKRYP